MRRMTDPEVLAAILARCDRTGACLVYRGWLGADGHALVRFHGSTTTAARAVYLIRTGKNPREVAAVRQTCGNRACCNFRHLVGATYKERAAAAKRATTYRPHTRQRKLTDDDVRAIRADERALSVVALQHRVNESVVSRIRRGLTKRLVPDVAT